MKNQSRNENIQSSFHKDARSSQSDEHRRHWSRFLIEHSELEDEYPDIEAAVAHTDKWRHEAELEIEKRFDDTGRCYANEAEKWYYRLGSTNPMNGGADILARAGMIMQRRAEREESSNRSQLISGCLFHEAALATDDSAIRNRFYLQALENYRPLIDNPSLSITDINRQLSLRYSYDVMFQQLFDRGLIQMRRGDYHFEPLTEQFMALQHQYIEEFLLLTDESELTPRTKSGDRYGVLKGQAFEWFSVAAYRHALWRNQRFGEATIRTAFPREDCPYFAPSNDSKRIRLPKTGFDVVVDRYEEGEALGRELIQLKVGRSKEGVYLPGIRTVGARGNRQEDFMELLRDSAKHMQCQYRGGSLSKDELATLRTTFEMVRPELLAA